ncbi:MAG: hypothetical protein J6I55_11205 [Ruminococcus sp.]|nr:hypothetical protein [Ruminococcus sp.]
MKKLISIALALFMCVGFSSCGGDDGYIEESSSEIVTTRKAESVVTEPEKMSKSKAYELAEAYVPLAMLDSPFLEDATNYKITNYEYEGIENKYISGEYVVDSGGKRDCHCFKFYGMYTEEDNYGDLLDYGYFYVNVYVAADSSGLDGKAYKDFSKK